MADSYIERHVSFGVDQFEGLWKLSFLHPFFYADTKRVITVYIIPPNSDFEGAEYNGIEVVDAGPNLVQVMTKLLPMIQNYPYRWELEGKKLDTFGYDLTSGLQKNGENVSSIDFTDIAFAEINRYYDFAEAVALPEVVTEEETIVRDAGLVKLDIVLEKAQWANQISFDFFTSYPIEIASVIYQEDTMKYSASYELPLESVQSSASSVSILFPSVFAKKFTVVLAQPTYTVATSNQSLTTAIIPPGVDIDEETLSISMNNYLDPTYDMLWGEDEVEYQKQKMEASALTKGAIIVNSSEWRPDYKAARAKADAQMVQYEQRLQEYQEAESKYKKDMEEYVRYQQQLADWYNKWGG